MSQTIPQRISGVVKPDGDYVLSILKSNMGKPQCLRFFFEYPAEAGLGHLFIHISAMVIRSRHLEGEPTPVAVETNDIEEWTKSYLESS